MLKKGKLVEGEELKNMGKIVPDSLQGLKVCRKLCITILLLLQLPPECAQLLLSFHLDIIRYDHSRLEVCLKTTPLLLFILKAQTCRIIYMLFILTENDSKTFEFSWNGRMTGPYIKGNEILHAFFIFLWIFNPPITGKTNNASVKFCLVISN